MTPENWAEIASFWDLHGWLPVSWDGKIPKLAWCIENFGKEAYGFNREGVRLILFKTEEQRTQYLLTWGDGDV